MISFDVIIVAQFKANVNRFLKKFLFVSDNSLRYN